MFRRPTKINTSPFLVINIKNLINHRKILLNRVKFRNSIILSSVDQILSLLSHLDMSILGVCLCPNPLQVVQNGKNRPFLWFLATKFYHCALMTDYFQFCTPLLGSAPYQGVLPTRVGRTRLLSFNKKHQGSNMLMNSRIMAALPPTDLSAVISLTVSLMQVYVSSARKSKEMKKKPNQSCERGMLAASSKLLGKMSCFIGWVD